jgi:hypothetical protein
MDLYVQLNWQIDLAIRILDGEIVKDECSAHDLKEALTLAANNDVGALIAMSDRNEIKCQEWMDKFYFEWDDIESQLPNYDYIRKHEYSENEYSSTMYVGSVMSLFPSGKYYIMGLTSNQTKEDVVKDTFFMKCFDACLQAKDYWREQGEGDPTDVLIGRLLTNEEIEELDEIGCTIYPHY